MFNQISHRRTRGRAARARNARAWRRPSVEGLEARTLLSTLFVDDAWSSALDGAEVAEGKVFGDNAFATIQSAIVKAVSGDEIDVAAGTYTGAVSIGKSLTIMGAGSGEGGTILNVADLSSAYAVSISASDVSFGGMTVTAAGSAVQPTYGVNASGTSGLTLTDLAVVSMTKSGVNLNGVTDFTITNVASRDNGGAGFFLQDAKRGTLTDVTTSGNAWTGLGLSTAGRYHAIGVEEITVNGASTFGEAATDNGGVMIEESSWNGTAYDPTNPCPITFSTNAADGADVTFAMDQPLDYALSGPQDDEWSARYRFYETAEQGMAAAAGDPTHFLDHDRTLATVGAFGDARTFLVAPVPAMSIQAAIDAAAAGDTVQIAAGTYTGAISIAKPLNVAGADATTTTLDVSAATSAYGVSIKSDGVSLSGLTITGATDNATLKYGVNAAGVANLALSDLVVASMPKSGVNLNGVTDFTITNVASRDNDGAGFFLQDAKRGTLTDVTTSGNAWTGLGFSTSGRYFPIGVEEITVNGASTFGEAATANGGVMMEESSWDGSAYDPTNPYPITFSTNASDGADVTFAMDQSLNYVLSGPQDDEWSVRRLFFETAEQGMAAAAGDPTHFLDHDRTLATVGAFGEARTFLVAPVSTMSIQAAIDAAAAGDTVQVGAGTYSENLAISQPITLRADGDARLQPSSGAAVTISAVGSDVSPTLARGFWIQGGDVGVAIQGTASHVTIESNVITGNGTGVQVDPGATNVQVHWNRIVDNTGSALANQAEDAVDAALNWWGSNDGPGGSVSGLVDSSPYIVLTLSNPGPILVGGSAAVTADLNHDSDGNDVSGLGSIPGVPDVGFSATLGGVSPDLAVLTDGQATSTFTAGLGSGQASVTATVDGAEAQVAFDVIAPSLSISGPATVNQGDVYTLTLTAGADAGVVSRWWIDWGDGSDPEEIAGSPATATHAYSTDPRSYVISARAETSLGVQNATDQVTVAVVNVGPSVAIASGPTSVDQGTQAAFTAVGSDPGGVVGYAWSASLGGVVVATGSGASFAFTPAAPGGYIVSVTATDAQGASAVASQALDVANVNPTLDLTAIPGRVDLGAPITLSASATDPNPNAALAYSWVVRRNGVVEAVGEGPALTFTPGVIGVYEVFVQVSDGEGGVATQSTSFEAAPLPTGPLPPVAERLVRGVVTLATIQTQRQEMRLGMLTTRFEARPSPMLQRMIQRTIRMRDQIQVMAARRVARIQRLADLMTLRRGR